MSLLVITPQPRPTEPGAGRMRFASPAEQPWAFVFSGDGTQVTQSSTAVAADWPKATRIVLALPPRMLSWHHLTIPKAPKSRMREALAGLLEDQGLQDDADLHLSLAPGLQGGETGLLAQCDKSELQALLMSLAQAGVDVQAVVPLFPPSGQGVQVHAQHDPEEADAETLQWIVRTPSGVTVLPASADAWTWIRHLGDGQEASPVALSADPDAVEDAERVLASEHPDTSSLQSRRQALIALEAARSGWNLLQFDIQAQARGQRRAQAVWMRWKEPEWRAARWGVGALAFVVLLGLNVDRWQLLRQHEQLKAQQEALFHQAFPNTPLVLAPEQQMGHALQQLQEQAGAVGDRDYERLVEAAAQVWPAGQSPEGLHYQGGVLELGLPTDAALPLDQARQQWPQWIFEQEGRLLRVRAKGVAR